MYIAQTSQKIVRIYAPWVEWKKVLIRLFELNLMGSKLNPIYFFFAFHFKDNITHATLATSKWNKWHDGAREVVLRWQIIKNFPFQGTLDLFIPREVLTWQIRGHLICSSQGRFWRDRSWGIWFLQEWFDQAQLHSMSVKDQARQAKLNYRWWRYMLLMKSESRLWTPIWTKSNNYRISWRLARDAGNCSARQRRHGQANQSKLTKYYTRGDLRSFLESWLVVVRALSAVHFFSFCNRALSMSSSVSELKY